METNSLHIIDYLIIIASLIISIGVGVRFSKAQSSTSKYFAGEGNVPAWAIGMSIFATLISSITFLAYPGDGFAGRLLHSSFRIQVGRRKACSRFLQATGLSPVPRRLTARLPASAGRQAVRHRSSIWAARNSQNGNIYALDRAHRQNESTCRGSACSRTGLRGDQSLTASTRRLSRRLSPTREVNPILSR